MRYNHFSMLPERAFQPRGRYGMTLEGGGGGGPTQSTVTQTNIPDWLRPQAEALLGAGTQEYFTTKPSTYTDPNTGETKTTYDITGIKPYTPYSVNPQDYFAGFSPLQQQVQYEAAGMQRPGGFGAGTELAGTSAMGGLEAAQRAAGYGAAGYGAGQLGQQIGTQGGGYYGGLGANYGAAAAKLAPEAQRYGALGTQYGQSGAGYGASAAGMAPQAQRYGQTAADIGQMGLRAEALGRDVGQEARGYARQAAGMGGTYERMATDPRAMQAYMSPYMQNVVDLQKQAAIRDYQENIMPQIQAQAVKAGAFGGSRDAVQRAMAQRNLSAQLQGIQATGTQKAYEDAQRAQQFGITTGLQGLSGAQAGLGTALQGGQLGLGGIGQAIAGQQAGLQGLGQAGQLYGQGIQGAQAGMQGAGLGLQGIGQAGQMYGLGMQGAGLGLQGVNAQLAGTAQGLQGAGLGLQGVSGELSGYGLAGQQATNLANIANQQQAADLARMQYQSQLGGAQQSYEQQLINQAVQNYALGQQYPYQQLAGYSGLLRGYATPTTTTSQYTAAPSPISQLSGLGLTGAAMYGLAKKKGGKIEEKKFADGGIASIDQKVINDPTAFSKETIQKGVANNTISKMAGAIALSEIEAAEARAKQAQGAQSPSSQGTILSKLMGDGGIGQAPSNMNLAGGGIVAFSGETDGSYVDPELLNYIREKETGGLQNPDLAVSPKGATGRMQVMPKTAMNPGFGVPTIFQLADASGVKYKGKTEDEAKRLLTDPDLNMTFAKQYTGALGQKFGGDPVLIAAAYNAGPGAVQRAGGVPDYPETQRYVAGLIPAEKLAGGPKINPSFIERQEAASEKVRGARREQMGLPPPRQATPPQPIPGAAAAIDQVADITRRGVAEDNQRLFSDMLYGRAPIPKRATPKDPFLTTEAPPPARTPAPKEIPATTATPETKPEEDTDIAALRKSIAARREELGKQKETDKYMALLAAGLGMMGGTSRHAMQNIGQGALQGVAAAQASRKEQREAEQDVLASELGLSRATLYEKMRVDQLKSNKEIAQAKNAIAQQLADLKQQQGYRDAVEMWTNSPSRTALETDIAKRYGKNWQQDDKAKLELQAARNRFIQELLRGGSAAGIPSYSQMMGQ